MRNAIKQLLPKKLSVLTIAISYSIATTAVAAPQYVVGSKDQTTGEHTALYFSNNGQLLSTVVLPLAPSSQMSSKVTFADDDTLFFCYTATTSFIKAVHNGAELWNTSFPLPCHKIRSLALTTGEDQIKSLGSGSVLYAIDDQLKVYAYSPTNNAFGVGQPLAGSAGLLNLHGAAMADDGSVFATHQFAGGYFIQAGSVANIPSGDQLQTVHYDDTSDAFAVVGQPGGYQTNNPINRIFVFGSGTPLSTIDFPWTGFGLPRFDLWKSELIYEASAPLTGFEVYDVPSGTLKFSFAQGIATYWVIAKD